MYFTENSISLKMLPNFLEVYYINIGNASKMVGFKNLKLTIPRFTFTK